MHAHAVAAVVPITLSWEARVMRKTIVLTTLGVAALYYSSVEVAVAEEQPRVLTASSSAGGLCDSECDWCHCGTEYENNCPQEWFYDGDCDCGCQYCDMACFDCAMQDCGGTPCGPACDFCWIGTEFQNNCPASWCNDGECDCGCQWVDQDCGGPPCTNGCNEVCGDEVCECECEESVDSCPADCVDVPCDESPADNVCLGDTREICAQTYTFCSCGPQCAFCFDGDCDPEWAGDGYCDCGCQFCDPDCPEYPDCCIPGPASHYVNVDAFSPTCATLNPPGGWSEYDPDTGEYVFCSLYTAGGCEDDVCVRLWLDEDGPCDPELWWQYHQNFPEDCALTTLVASEPADQGSLWRPEKNVVRLTFGGTPPAAPVAGEIQINELLPAGVFGPDLSGSFALQMESGTVLRIEDAGASLEHRKWYAIRNVGGWSGVAEFEVQYLLQAGDCDGNGLVISLDVGCVNAQIPCFTNCGDGNRADIDGDGRVISLDVGVVNGHIGSFAVPKPSGH